MENIRIKLIKLFNEHKHTVELPLIEGIAELFYLHQGDLEETVDTLYTRLDKYRREVSTLQANNEKLFDTLVETSTKYADAIVLATEQFDAEMRFKEREALEKEV